MINQDHLLKATTILAINIGLRSGPFSRRLLASLADGCGPSLRLRTFRCPLFQASRRAAMPLLDQRGFGFQIFYLPETIEIDTFMNYYDVFWTQRIE